MKTSSSASASAESSSRISPTASARRTLRRISWRTFLDERAQVGLDVGAVRQRDDRADVLALDVERPAFGHLEGAERRGQRVGRRIAAAQPAQVDDVPRPAVGRSGEVGGQRGRHGRKVGRVGQDRRVVGVVRGAEEDRRGRRRDRRQLEIGAVAHLGVGQLVARLDLVAMHQRHDGQRLGVRRRRPGPRRRASPRARSRRTRPTTRAGRPSPRTGSPRGSGPRPRPTSRAGCRRAPAARPAGAPRRLPGRRSRSSSDRQAPRRASGKSRSNASTGSGFGCHGNGLAGGTFVRSPTADRVGHTAPVAHDVVAGERGFRPAGAGVIARTAVRSYALPAFAISLVILVLRYPTAILAAEPLWEDGPIFYLGAFDGLGSLARPYQGYLHVAARMVAHGGGRRSAGARTAGHERGDDPGHGRGRGVHRQRPAEDRGAGPPHPAGARDRLRADAGGAGPVLAPRLPAVDAGVLPARPRARRRARPALGLARSRRGGGRGLDRAVLDPVRAAVRVAAPAARAHGLDRRRLRAHPARLHRDGSSRPEPARRRSPRGSRSWPPGCSPSRCSAIA